MGRCATSVYTYGLLLNFCCIGSTGLSTCQAFQICASGLQSTQLNECITKIHTSVYGKKHYRTYILKHLINCIDTFISYYQYFTSVYGKRHYSTYRLKQPINCIDTFINYYQYFTFANCNNHFTRWLVNCQRCSQLVCHLIWPVN